MLTLRGAALVALLCSCSSSSVGLPCVSNANCPGGLVCAVDCRCQAGTGQDPGRCGDATRLDGGLTGGGAAGGTAGGAAGGMTAGGASGGSAGGNVDAGAVGLGGRCTSGDRCEAGLTCHSASPVGVCSRGCSPNTCPPGFVCSSHRDFTDVCLKTCTTNAPGCAADMVCDVSGGRTPSPTQGTCVPACTGSDRGTCSNADNRCVNGLCCGASRSVACPTGRQCLSLDAPVDGVCP